MTRPAQAVSCGPIPRDEEDPIDISRGWRILSQAFGRGVFPHQMSWFLDLPGRGLILSARTVADRLAVAPDAEVLEVGPGSGYHSVAVAQRVPEGRLTLLDIQPEMLDKSTRRLEAAGLSNHTAVVSDGKALPFEDGSFDALFLVTVFGEIGDQASFLSEAFRVLRPGGVLSITEHHPDPDLEPVAVVSAALREHGFQVSEPMGWRWAFTVNGVRPA